MPVVERADDRAPVPPPAPSPGHIRSARGWIATNWQLAIAVLLGAIVVTPIVAAGIAAVGTTWYPVGDWAAIELRTLDVGTRHTPLLGPYSRYGWNHPGPLLFWLYAVPYRISGGAPWSLLVAAATVNAASVGGMLAFAWRRGRLPLVGALAVAVSLVILNVEPGMIRDPWNPWVTALPFGLLVILAWSAVEGDRWAVPLMALVGSFLVQAHVGFLALVAALGIWAAVGYWRRGGPPRAFALAGIVLALCWAPVVLDLLVGQRNPIEMLRHFAGTDEQPAGVSVALGIAARQFGHVAPWLGGEEPPNPIGGALLTRALTAMVVPMVVFGLALAAAWWRRRVGALRFQATVAVTALVGLVSVARVTDEVFNYLVRWWWLVVVLWWASIAWSTWSVLDDLWSRLTRLLLPVVAASSLVATAWFSLGALDEIDGAPLPIPDWQPAMAAVADDAVDGALPARGPVLVQDAGPSSGWAFDGIIARLEAEGVEVRVLDDDVNVNKYGPQRVTGGDERFPEVWVVTGTPIEEFADDDRFEMVARFDPLAPDERRRYVETEAALVGQLRAAGLDDVVYALERGLSLFPARGHPDVDQDLLDEVDRFRRAGQPLAVFVDPEPAGRTRHR